MTRLRASALLVAGLAVLAHADQPALTRPAVSGSTIVFTAEGDLWTYDLASKVSKRLTSHPGTETNAKFSPDGTQIAFTAQYDGASEVYVMALAGGIPRRLTFDGLNPVPQGWTADGKRVLFRSVRANAFFVNQLYTVPATGGVAEMVPVPEGEFGSFAKDGKLAYVPVSNEWANWFRYEAGAADDIWQYDPASKRFDRLTTYRGVDTSPVWADDQIYYISEQSGQMNLWRLDAKTRRTRQLTKNTVNPIRYPQTDGKTVVFESGLQLGMLDIESGAVTPLDLDLRSDRINQRPQRLSAEANLTDVGIGPTGKRLVITARGQILSVPVENGDVRVLENVPGARALHAVWSPDGKTIAYASDRSGEYEIWTLDSTGKTPPKQLTTGFKGHVVSLVWSPNGKLLAARDRSARIVVIDAATGKTTPVSQSDFTASYDTTVTRLVFSPDSRLLAAEEFLPRYQTGVFITDLTANKTYRLGVPGMSTASPSFSPDGKQVAFVATRSIQPSWDPFTGRQRFLDTQMVNIVSLTADAPSPFLPKNDDESATEAAKPAEPAKPEPKPGTKTEEKAAGEKAAEEKPAEEKPKANVYDLEAANFRTVSVPAPASNYSQVLWSGNRLLLVDAAPTSEGPGAGSLIAFDLEKKAPTPIAEGVTGVEVSADGKKLLVSTPAGVSVIDAETGPAELKPVSLRGATVTVDPRAEWKQVFNDAWRACRDFFYDPGMHGVDWAAVRTKYAAQLERVGDRTDLTRLLKDMVAELNVGHAYVTNPAPRSVRPVALGYLGADFEAAPVGVKIAKLYRGDAFDLDIVSPLLLPGVEVKEGQYLLSIAGQPILPNQDPAELLLGLAGQTVALEVNDKPSKEGARTVRVKVMSRDENIELRYQDWVRGRAEYVRKTAGPDFGYLHVSDMTDAGMKGFIKGAGPNRDKQGVVFDFRYNGGGNISSVLLETIAARADTFFKPRDGAPWGREDWSFYGHKVALCNERNFSDGELVIDSWQQMKLGPVVGKTTGGGEVGSGGGYPLVDGGAIFVPNYAAYRGGKWIIEGVGAIPDIEVDQDPAAVMAGKDPQLDRAIAILKEQAAKKPIRVPAHPAFPDKSKTGSAGGRKG